MKERESERERKGIISAGGMLRGGKERRVDGWTMVDVGGCQWMIVCVRENQKRRDEKKRGLVIKANE